MRRLGGVDTPRRSVPTAPSSTLQADHWQAMEGRWKLLVQALPVLVVAPAPSVVAEWP